MPKKKCEAGNTSQNASNCEFGGLKQKLIVVARERRRFLSLILVLLHLTEVADTWMLLRQPSSFLEDTFILVIPGELTNSATLQERFGSTDFPI